MSYVVSTCLDDFTLASSLRLDLTMLDVLSSLRLLLCCRFDRTYVDVMIGVDLTRQMLILCFVVVVI